MTACDVWTLIGDRWVYFVLFYEYLEFECFKQLEVTMKELNAITGGEMTTSATA